MAGIIYPANWKEIIEKGEVIAASMHLDAGALKKVLIEKLLMAVKAFKDDKFCLALSGGLDSSVLAVLLTRMGVDFTALTIGRNDNHPDIAHAKILHANAGFKHKVVILSGTRISSDAYDDLFKIVKSAGFNNVICADTVDEMLGGYWMHGKAAETENQNAGKLKSVFEDLWKELPKIHLEAMEKYAKKHGVSISLPYLGANEFLRNIEMRLRVNREMGKIILRNLAKEIGVPEIIIKRPKLGLCSIWDELGLTLNR